MKRWHRRLLKELRAAGIRFSIGARTEYQIWRGKDEDAHKRALAGAKNLKRRKKRGLRWKMFWRAFLMEHKPMMKSRRFYVIGFDNPQDGRIAQEAARRHWERKNRQRVRAGGRH